eukprot:3938794-Rhodomonas_salina.1
MAEWCPTFCCRSSNLTCARTPADRQPSLSPAPRHVVCGHASAFVPVSVSVSVALRAPLCHS